MSGNSNFLVFNPTDTTNTEDDATYAAEPQRTNGLENGIAKTSMHNKFYRQVSVMAAALAQFMANQGQTVSDSDLNALTTVISNSFMQRGATVLDTGIDADTYVWQNGVYSGTTNVVNMPVSGHAWIMAANVIDTDNVALIAYDLSIPGYFYLRQKARGTWGSWINSVAPLASSTPSGETVGASGSAGTSTSAARADHIHPMPAAYTPSAHASSHASGGSDQVTPAAIGAAIQNDFSAHLADDVKHVYYAATTGSANTYTVTLSPVPTAYVDGMAVAVKINVASTGASTLNVNGLGAKTILDSLGNAITSGGLKAGIIYSLRYNSTTGNFIVQGKGGGGNAGAGDLLSGKTATVDTGPITGAMPNYASIAAPSGVDTQIVSIGNSSTYPSDGGITFKPAFHGNIDENTQIIQYIKAMRTENIKAGVNVGNGSAYMTGTFTSDANATAGQILNGQTAYVNGAKITGSMPIQTNCRIIPSTSWSGLSAGYFDNAHIPYVDGEPNLIAANILSGVSIFGVAGSAINGAGMMHFASGTVTNFSGNLIVSGLSFAPQYFMVWITNAVDPTYDGFVAIGSTAGDISFANGSSYLGYELGFWFTGHSGSFTYNSEWDSTGGATPFTSNGFKDVYCPIAANYKWVAFG